MTIAHPTAPSNRWLEQGQTLTRLKEDFQGDWMVHYETVLKPQYRFSPRSEQLCRHIYGLWLYCLENGERMRADEICRNEHRVNYLRRDLKALRSEIDNKKSRKWLQDFGRQYARAN